MYAVISGSEYTLSTYKERCGVSHVLIINLFREGHLFAGSKYQGSHRSGKSGKTLKTFSNQGKTEGFQLKSGKKISNQGTFFQNHFQTF